MRRPNHPCPAYACVLALAVLAALAQGCACCRTGERASPPNTRVDKVDYHGWKNALRLSSQEAEVIVVPQIGRVMSFRRQGSENVFWEDRTLDGRTGDASGKEWVNFGGDKTWPAPEAEWGRYTGYQQWMPPPAFDGLPAEGRIDGQAVVLTSPVDKFYGIRTARRITLASNTLSITTTYERISGPPSKVGVWVITQFKEPDAVLVPVRTNSVFTNGHLIFWNEPWPQLRREGRHLRITRDPNKAHKMGSDADELVWVRANEICVVRAPRVTGAEYPDQGASAEVYTNPDPKKYVELEMLGPLSVLATGYRMAFTQTYTLTVRPSPLPPR